MKKTLYIDGMTCTSCENRIERKLSRTQGVISANVSYIDGTATITFVPEKVTLEKISEIIIGLDYKVYGGKGGNVNAKNIFAKPVTQALGVIAILYALYLILGRIGVLDIFNIFPEAEIGMGYGVIFVIGLLTSVHCIAMCGGINLSQSVGCQSGGTCHKSKTAGFLPAFLYNMGRVISYTLIGGIVGFIGQAVSFSSSMKGAVQIAAGVFMVIMGLNMLGIFPWLRRFSIRMPKLFAKKLDNQSVSSTPLVVGLLNGFMPCGPLQTMQLYALSTGNPVTGALSMMLFALGTVPLMFGIGAISSLLSKKFAGKMMTASAALVLLMGLSMFQNGINMSGVAVSATSGGAVAAATADGVQIVNTTLARRQYEPITVQAGVPVRWTITAPEGSVNNCNNRFIIREYDNLEKRLAVGENVVEFTPTRAGVFPYSCWMGMIHGSITVLDADGTAPPAPPASPFDGGRIPNLLPGQADECC